MEDILSNEWEEKQQKLLTNLLYSPALFNYFYDETNLVSMFIPQNDQNLCIFIDQLKNEKSNAIPMRSNDNGNDVRCQMLKFRCPENGILYTDKKSPKISFWVNKLDILFTRYKPNPHNKYYEITNRQDDINDCLVQDINIAQMDYMGSDVFTNNLLIGYILNYRLPDFPFYVTYYGGGICDTNGVIVMETNEFGKLSNFPHLEETISYRQIQRIREFGDDLTIEVIDGDIIGKILIQITMGLYILQKKVYFINGELTVDDIYLQNRSVEMLCEGVKIIAPFICKIGNYGRTAVILRGKDDISYRFYNSSGIEDNYWSRQSYELNIGYTGLGDKYYILDNAFILRNYDRVRRLGIPTYHSIDYYTLIISLLRIQPFYYGFFGREELVKIYWDSIWLDPGDNQLVRMRVRQEMMSGNFSTPIELLRNVKLRCNVMHTVISLLYSYKLS